MGWFSNSFVLCYWLDVCCCALADFKRLKHFAAKDAKNAKKAQKNILYFLSLRAARAMTNY